VKWHYIDCRERAQKFVLKVSKLPSLISEQQDVSNTPYICPTPSNIWKATEVLKVYRLRPLVLLIKSSFKMKTSMRRWWNGSDGGK
jgi:hypothetical protein